MFHQKNMAFSSSKVAPHDRVHWSKRMGQVVGLMVETHEVVGSILNGGYAFNHPSTCA
jgi:hypothetical protein